MYLVSVVSTSHDLCTMLLCWRYFSPLLAGAWRWIVVTYKKQCKLCGGGQFISSLASRAAAAQPASDS